MMLMLEFTEVGMQEADRMSLMISFVQKLKGWIVFPLWLCRKVELCMEGG